MNHHGFGGKKKMKKGQRDPKRRKKSIVGTSREYPITLDNYFTPAVAVAGAAVADNKNKNKKKSTSSSSSAAITSAVSSSAANGAAANSAAARRQPNQMSNAADSSKKKPDDAEVIDLLSSSSDEDEEDEPTTKPTPATTIKAQSTSSSNKTPINSRRGQQQEQELRSDSAAAAKKENRNSTSHNNNNQKRFTSASKNSSKKRPPPSSLSSRKNYKPASAAAIAFPPPSVNRRQQSQTQSAPSSKRGPSFFTSSSSSSPGVSGGVPAAPTNRNQMKQQNVNPVVPSTTTAVASSHAQQQPQQQEDDEADQHGESGQQQQLPDGWMKEGNHLYSLNEFNSMMESVEINIGHLFTQIEDGALVSTANNNMSSEDSKSQHNAMYGRLYPEAAEKLFRILELSSPNSHNKEIFVDIGHGIGSLVFQAAYTKGVDAHGIEVVGKRYTISCIIQDDLSDLVHRIHPERDQRSAPVGTVKLRHGCLEAPEQLDFLTEYRCNQANSNKPVVIKAFLNNFNGVFKDRCVKNNDKYLLEDFVAGLFASMAPGSILVTVDPLLNLGPSRTEANEYRNKQGLDESIDASYYEADTASLSLGLANESVSWSYGGGCKKLVRAYKYVRVQNSTATKNNDAVFLCSNPKCQNCKSGKLIPAVEVIPYSVKRDGDSKQRVEFRRVVQTACPDCKMAPRIRHRNNNKRSS